MAHQKIGMEIPDWRVCWCGPADPGNIRVIVYAPGNLAAAKLTYVSDEKAQRDFRFLEAGAALAYLTAQIDGLDEAGAPWEQKLRARLVSSARLIRAHLAKRGPDAR